MAGVPKYKVLGRPSIRHLYASYTPLICHHIAVQRLYTTYMPLYAAIRRYTAILEFEVCTSH